METEDSLHQHRFGAHLCQEAHPHHQPAMPHFVQHPPSSSADHVKASNKRFLSHSHKGEGSFCDNRKDLGGISNDRDDDGGVDGDDDDEDNHGDSDEDCDEEEDHSAMEGREDHQDAGDGIGIIQEGMAWHRTKWTSDMVVLLIKTVHSVGEDGSNSIIIDNPSSASASASASASGSKRKASSLLQKKGKWRLVSMKMNEARCYVSPQQCEDKFNDLNKRYKRLNDVLGKEAALEAVGRPGLLDGVKGISPKVKEDARKILTSKHTFYREMHAFYNNGLDPIPKPLQSPGEPLRLPGDEDRGVADAKGAIRLLDENLASSRQKPGYEPENFASSQKQSYESGLGGEKLTDYGIARLPARIDEARAVGSNPSLLDERKDAAADRMFADRMLELERRKVAIQSRALELERRFFRWQRQRAHRDADLEKLREENRRMKAENDRLSLLLNLQLMPKKPQEQQKKMMMMI